jgi:uncharacterized SAM-binding protein YcdF (DUF218 family)
LFFVISKLFAYVFLLANFLIGIGLIGAILLLTRFRRLGRRLMVVAVVLLAICGFLPTGNLLLYPLETRFPAWDETRGPPDGIIALGGSIDEDLSAAHGTTVVRGDAGRIFATAALAHKYPNARVVFSGGSANLLWNDAKEADYAGTLFESLGVAKSRLLLERQSRNTDENAKFSKAAVAPKQGERWVLVTSAYHMPRSVGLFRKAGFPVEAHPVDWRVGGHGDLVAISKIASSGIARTDMAIREWIGLFTYWATGKIDDLFPGPKKN